MIFLLSLCAFLTSTISGIIGMGGGVLLLSIMSLLLDYKALIPIHGLIQLVSNSSRSFYLRKNIKWDFFKPFLLGVPIGFVVAFFILKQIKNPAYYYLLLACFIFYTVFKPKKLPSIKLKRKGWMILGFFSGIQGSLIGATGPLLAPFFLRDDLSKEEIVATKAAQQIVTHFLKIPLFLTLSFNYFEYIDYIGAMCLTTILGTLLGVKLLGKVEERIFKILFKIVLFIAAVRLIIKFWSLIS